MPANLRDALHDVVPRRVPDLDFDQVWRRHRRARAGRIAGGIAVSTIVVAGSFGLVERLTDDARPLPADDPPAEPGGLPASPDDWVRMRAPAGATIQSIAVGEPGLVAVGNANDVTAAWTSQDGESWERADGPDSAGVLLDVTRTPSGLIAVGHNFEDDGDTAHVWSSVDGVEWDQLTGISVFDGAWLDAVIAGGPGLVALGTLPQGPQAWYSTDGVGWRAAAVPSAPDDIRHGVYDSAPGRTAAFVDDVAVIGDRLVVIGSYTVSDPAAIGGDRAQRFIWTSLDGVIFEDTPLDETAFPADSSIASITSGPGGGVAVGWYIDRPNRARPEEPGQEAAAWASPDGRTWQRVSAGQDAFTGILDDYLSGAGLTSLAANDRGYVAVGDTNSGEHVAVVLTSVDGRAWQRMPDGPTFVTEGWTSIHFVTTWGSRFVAVGEYGGERVIWISD